MKYYLYSYEVLYNTVVRYATTTPTGKRRVHVLPPLIFATQKTNAVLDYLNVKTYHLLAHGSGAEAALELGRSLGKSAPRPPGPELGAILSVTLASPVLGGNELPPDFLESLRAQYTRGGNEVRGAPCFVNTDTNKRAWIWKRHSNAYFVLSRCVLRECTRR